MDYIHLKVLTIGLGIFLYSPLGFAQGQTNQLQKWEYKVVNSCVESDRAIDIQQLGEEGWQLTTTDASNCVINYFKRPKRGQSKRVTPQQLPQPAAPQCSVPLDKAPAIRGLRLGMSFEEIIALVSDNKKNEIRRNREKADLAPGYGLWDLYIFNRSDFIKEAQEKFVGIDDIRLSCFDGRVVRINVMYDNNVGKYPSWTIDEWTAKVSSTFSLPPINNWELSRNKMARTLKCKDIEIETRVVINGPSLPGFGSYSYPIITITDQTYRQVQEQRAKSDQEKKQREFVF